MSKKKENRRSETSSSRPRSLSLSLSLSLFRLSASPALASTSKTHRRGRTAGPRSTPQGPCRPWRDEFSAGGTTAQKRWNAESAGALVPSPLSSRVLSLSLVARRSRRAVEALVASQRSSKIEARHAIHPEEARENAATKRERERAKTMDKKKNSRAGRAVFFLLLLYPLPSIDNLFLTVARSLAWPLLLQQQLRLLQRLRLPEMLAKVRKEAVEKRRNGRAPGWRLMARSSRSLAHSLAHLDLLLNSRPPLKTLPLQKKVIVWLRATGDAPILKQQRYKVGANERFSKVVDLLRERLKKDSLVRAAFFSFFCPPCFFFSTSTSTSTSSFFSFFLSSLFSFLSSSTSKSPSPRASTSASGRSRSRTARRAARS